MRRCFAIVFVAVSLTHGTAVANDRSAHWVTSTSRQEQDYGPPALAGLAGSSTVPGVSASPSVQQPLIVQVVPAAIGSVRVGSFPNVIDECGAIGDGVTDDKAAFNSCAAKYADFFVPPTANGYRISDDGTTHLGIQIPMGHAMNGVFTWAPGGTTPSAKIVCDLAVTPCVNLGMALNTRSMATTSATSSGAVLRFNSTAGIKEGMPIYDETSGVIPNGALVLSTTPTTVTLNKSPTGVVGSGEIIQFGAVAGSYAACGLRQIEVTRAAGTIPPGSIAIQFNQCNPVNVDTVLAARAAEGYYLLHSFDGTSGWGGDFASTRAYTDQISDKHLVLDGWYIATLESCNFGLGNAPIPTAAAYIGVTGGNSNDVGGGPDGLQAVNCMFNAVGGPGNPSVTNFLQFYDILGTQGDIWQVSQSHIASVSNMIAGDSTLPALVGVTFEHNNSEAGLLSSQQMFSLDTNTKLYQVTLADNQFQWVPTYVKVAPKSAQIYGLRLLNNDFGSGAISLTSNNSASDVTVIGNTATGGNIVAGAWAHFVWRANYPETVAFSPGSPTVPKFSSAEPDVYVTGRWAPTLVGSSTAGAPTYVYRTGSYEENGRMVTVRFDFATSALGGSAGSMTIGNLPVVATASPNEQGGACSWGYLQGITLGPNYGALLGSVQNNGNWINLNEWGSGQSTVPITAGMLANTTRFQGTCTYRSLP